MSVSKEEPHLEWYSTFAYNYTSVLCKRLEQPFISLYFAKTMGNRYSDLLKHTDLDGNIKQKQSQYNSNELQSK